MKGRDQPSAQCCPQHTHNKLWQFSKDRNVYKKVTMTTKRLRYINPTPTATAVVYRHSWPTTLRWITNEMTKRGHTTALFRADWGGPPSLPILMQNTDGGRMTGYHHCLFQSRIRGCPLRVVLLLPSLPPPVPPWETIQFSKFKSSPLLSVMLLQFSSSLMVIQTVSYSQSQLASCIK